MAQNTPTEPLVDPLDPWQPAEESTIDAEEESDVAATPLVDGGAVVGIDGSSGSLRALRWAIKRAERFGPIQPISVWQYPWWAHAAPIPPPVDRFREVAAHDIQDALSSVPRGSHLPPITCRGNAGRTLVDIGRTAELIVVGTRGRSGLKDTLLGSVSNSVVSHATVPVAIIPTGAPTEDVHGRVVVGVDGSPTSVDALAWAIEYTPTESIIEAVIAWTYPTTAIPGPAMVSRGHFESQAHRILDDAVHAAVAATGIEHPNILKRADYGDARAVLRDRADEADLLVVGARGRGGLSHLLLGSVASALVHQPRVPTVVLPSPTEQ